MGPIVFGLQAVNLYLAYTLVSPAMLHICISVYMSLSVHMCMRVYTSVYMGTRVYLASSVHLLVTLYTLQAFHYWCAYSPAYPPALAGALLIP